jgi:hypothetical protein
MVLGIHLLFALLAGCVFWLVGWLCARLGGPAWLCAILSFGLGVYTFWALQALGPVQIGH